MQNHAVSNTPSLSVVIPMHNSAPVLARTIERWQEYLQVGLTEIILVENGSTDVTWDLAHQVAHDTANVHFVFRQSAKGMGNALREGISVSRGKRVLLSADDLPFDFGDLEGARKLSPRPPIVIGSKAHPESQTSRAFHRHIFTMVYRLMRLLILRSAVGDSQGTIIADGDWLRCISTYLTEPGFLFTTQLVYAAELQGIDVHEVPINFSHDRSIKDSTVRWCDAWRMGVGLFRLRRSRSDLVMQISATVVEP